MMPRPCPISCRPSKKQKKTTKGKKLLRFSSSHLLCIPLYLAGAGEADEEDAVVLLSLHLEQPVADAPHDVRKELDDATKRKERKREREKKETNEKERGSRKRQKEERKAREKQ